MTTVPNHRRIVDVFIYGKTTANAIAVMSYLASRPGQRAGSTEIAAARGISKPLTAKLLTQLAVAGLVSGQPGPGGGYTLARSAETIRLADIVAVFEGRETPPLCPFGHNWCGNGNPCPLHDKIAELQEMTRRFLEETRLSAFAPSTGDDLEDGDRGLASSPCYLDEFKDWKP